MRIQIPASLRLQHEELHDFCRHPGRRIPEAAPRATREHHL